jgi:hypothetical protein
MRTSPPDWMEIYRRLVAYKNKYGTTHVPSSWEPDPKLGKWVGNQRIRCKRKDRVDLMNQIGFELGYLRDRRRRCMSFGGQKPPFPIFPRIGTATAEGLLPSRESNPTVTTASPEIEMSAGRPKLRCRRTHRQRMNGAERVRPKIAKTTASRSTTSL